MEDFLFVEETGEHLPTRLDLLLYAHDGRGFGHASRAIAIGMAVKRLYPRLHVLFVSGSPMGQSLISFSGLDWIKLPSYSSTMVDGVSTGINGPSNFSKFVLAKHRQTMLSQLVTTFHPRMVLVDHSPCGKRQELMTALEASKTLQTKWILGLRAVLGTSKNFFTEQACSVFKSYYSDVLWYGDKTILGRQFMEEIERHLATAPIEMGYVSRLFELQQFQDTSPTSITGVISLPRLKGNAQKIIRTLVQALKERDVHENWQIFVSQEDLPTARENALHLPNCKILQTGEAYSQAISQAQCAIIYGGYNSLMDVIACDIPAIVLMRDVQDKEQTIHLQKLMEANPGQFSQLRDDQATPQLINQSIDLMLSRHKPANNIDITGSSRVATHLLKLLDQEHPHET